MNVSVRYFALLRDERGLSSEQAVSDARTVSDLYEELKERHGFSLSGQILQFVVNNVRVPAQEPLKDGDVVVFLPPVSGG
ncbi:MAG: MoaD/ThiS family protein [Armatimonadetes bacterium]|nr:MoaD/ThiS family protein [Armatimonadota bacterium]